MLKATLTVWGKRPIAFPKYDLVDLALATLPFGDRVDQAYKNNYVANLKRFKFILTAIQEFDQEMQY